MQFISAFVFMTDIMLLKKGGGDMQRNGGMTNDKLKIIAAAAMLIDHIGAYILPSVIFLRMIGRIAFPVFAFMIAEGCEHTENKKKYFRNIFVLALLCQVVFYPFKPPTHMRIPVTFLVSVTVIFLLQNCAAKICGESSRAEKAVSVLILLLAVLAVAWVNEILVIDYGFWGCMTPVMVSAGYYLGGTAGKDSEENILYRKIGMLATALIFVYKVYGDVQIYAFLSIPLLAMYNGRRENIVPKYFFYVFYPMHLAVIYGIQIILK